jgi:hypothetical protein
MFELLIRILQQGDSYTGDSVCHPCHPTCAKSVTLCVPSVSPYVCQICHPMCAIRVTLRVPNLSPISAIYLPNVSTGPRKT